MTPERECASVPQERQTLDSTLCQQRSDAFSACDHACQILPLPGRPRCSSGRRAISQSIVARRAILFV